jgi:hypothetical protein
MKNEFTYVELSDEQLELVVGGAGGPTNATQTAIAANFGGSFATNQQNANATNQFARGRGFNFNETFQTNFLRFP